MSDPDRHVRVDTRLKLAAEAGRMPKELVIAGPAGTGKTRGILTLLHLVAAAYPNLRILIVRQTRSSLTNSICVTYESEILTAAGMEHIAAGASRANRQSYVYPNKTEIVLGGLDKPGRIASTAWDLVYPAEAAELQEEGWETLGSRLDRPGRPKALGWLIADTNPGAPSHWLKVRCDQGRTALWETTHEANPGMHDGAGWTADGEAYLARLDRLTGTRRKRLRDGLWSAGAGQWFETFDPAANVDPSAEYDRRWPVFLGVDTGKHSGAVWFQIRGEGDDAVLTVFADYFSDNVPAYVVAQQIMAVTRERCGKFDVGRYDPAGGARVGFGGMTIAAEYERAGLRLQPWYKGPGCIAAGLTVLESFVATDPTKFLVHPRCARTVEAFLSYRRKLVGANYVDEPEDDQHPHSELIDAIRSSLLDRFPAGRRPEPRFNYTNVRNLIY